MSYEALIIRGLLVVFGTILSIQDIRTRSVGIVPLCGFCLSAFANYFITHEVCFIPFLILTSIGVFYKIFQKRNIAGLADYIMFFAISFILKHDDWPLFITLCGGIGTLYALLFRIERFAFIPVLLLSILLCCII